MSARTVSINGTAVDVTPSARDLANARTMLNRFGDPDTRDAFASHMTSGFDENVARWVRRHGERVAVAMARIALAVAEVHAELVAGRQS